MGKNWGRTTVKEPKFEAFLISNNRRNPNPYVRQVRITDEIGVTKKVMLDPGDLIFTDQFESILDGQIYTYKG